MASRGKEKGDRAEREVEDLLAELGIPARRMLGAGRKDDVGDIDRVPLSALQVFWRNGWQSHITEKLADLEQQRRNRRTPFSALFIRRTRVKAYPWVIVMEPKMWAKMHFYAVIGYRAVKRGEVTPPPQSRRLVPHGRDRRT